MGNSMRKLFCLVLLVPFLCGAGEIDRNLKDLNGNAANIEDHVGKGKWLLVMIWATDCTVCYHEAPEIAAFHARHASDDATVLGIALDGYDQVDAVESFVNDRNMNFPNLIAEMPDFAYRYETDVGERLMGTPTFLLFTPDGKLIANNPGPVKPSAVENFIAKNTTN